MANEFLKFVDRFAALHRRAKIAPLPAPEQAEYDELKELFARSMCEAQSIVVPSGQPAHAFFRVQSVLKVEITLGGATVKTSTMDVSMGGFTSITATPPAIGATASFKMSLSPRTVITGQAIVASAEKDRVGKQHRVSFAFSALSPENGQLLEAALFDSVLVRTMTPMPFGTPAASPPPRRSSHPEMKRVSTATPVPVVHTPQAFPRPPMPTPTSSPAIATRGERSPAPPVRPPPIPETPVARPRVDVERKKSVDDLLADAVEEMRGASDAARREYVPIARRSRSTFFPRVLAAWALVGAAIAIGLLCFRARLRGETASATHAASTTSPAPPSASIAVAAPPPITPSATASTQAPMADAGTSRGAVTSTIGKVNVAVAGRRVYIDGRLVGEGPRVFPVTCGAHRIRVGSAGATRRVDVPCGSVVDVAKP